MQKAPFLAALALAAACDDSSEIKAFLEGPDVQNIIAAVQERCGDLIKHGHLLGNHTTDDSFIAIFHDSNCQCDVDAYDRRGCEFKHSDDEGQFERLFLRDNTVHGERVSVIQIQDWRPTISISVDPYRDRFCGMRVVTDSRGCGMRVVTDSPHSGDFYSERPDVMKACRDFRDKVRGTITAIMDMVRQR